MKRWPRRFVQWALPAVLGLGLVGFAAQTAMDAYHSFDKLEGSRSSNVILSSRRILDEAQTIESTLRTIRDHPADFTLQSERALRDTLTRLITSLRLARVPFEADPEVDFSKRTSSILALARGMVIAIDEENGRRPDGYVKSLASDVSQLDNKFRLLRDDLDRESARYINEQSDLMLMSLGSMQKMFFSLIGAVMSVLVLLFLNNRAAAKAEFRAEHDVMTGALNRRAFESWIEMASAAPAKTPTAVMVLDLDDFKDVNDEFGHLAGDTLIKAFVRSIQNNFGAETRLVRWGGDEFVLVINIEGYIEAGAVTMLRTAFARLPSTVDIDGDHVHLSASGGVAFYPGDSDNLRETLQLADLALFNAKTRGKGRLQFFDREMQNERLRVHALRDRLRRALADGELMLYWQPLVDVFYPHVHSAEALIRWYDPRAERWVPPSEFIPIAETSDLIIAIDHFVLDEAIRTGARWAQKWAHPPTVAVNVSAVHFQQRDFVEQVRDLLRRHGMHPSQLELEITEGVVLGDNAEVKRNLDGLTQLGVRIALDDFGTGYSNIAYLSHLKPDRLKIDQTFIRRLGNNPHIRSLVSAIIGIGRAIDCEVVAEGVETAEQLSEIKSLGCQLVQGFYFARPMPVADFENWREVAGYSDEASGIQRLRLIADRMAAAEQRTDQRSATSDGSC